MTREFVYTAPFQRSWKAMGLGEEDQKHLEEALLNNPQAGDVIEGTGGARKMRIQLEGRGKSGGGRIIYVDVFEKEKLYLPRLRKPAQQASPMATRNLPAPKTHVVY